MLEMKTLREFVKGMGPFLFHLVISKPIYPFLSTIWNAGSLLLFRFFNVPVLVVLFLPVVLSTGMPFVYLAELGMRNFS